MSNSIEDAEANYFAMQLLVPDKMLLDEIAGGSIDLCDDKLVLRLAKKFGVSTTIIAFRLAEIGEPRLRA